MSSVDTDSIDLEEDKKYYLISPDGSLFHEIPLTETDYLTREVWVSYCPSCGKIRGYYYSRSEANRNSRICEECIRRYLHPSKKYRGCLKQNVNFRLFTKGYRKYKNVIYSYMEIK